MGREYHCRDLVFDTDLMGYPRARAKRGAEPNTLQFTSRHFDWTVFQSVVDPSAFTFDNVLKWVESSMVTHRDLKDS